MNQGTFDYERYKRLPHVGRTVYQGPEGTYNSLAAVQFSLQYLEAGFSHMKTFDAAVRTVDKGTGDYIVLPIENSTAGSVADGHGTLVEYEASVVGEYLLPARHALLVCDDAVFTDIQTAYSYPRGIEQYTPSFEEYLEIGAAVVSSTAVAAQLVQVMGKGSVVAIASTYAGQIYGPKVLIPTLSRRAENTTYSLIVGKEKLYLCGAKTVSLTMEIRHEAGVLYHALGALYAESVNLLRLTAYPVPEVSWVYRFFLDSSGSLEEAMVQCVLRGVERPSTGLRAPGRF